MRRQQEENMIKIAIMGYGTIGSGVYEVLEQNQDMIAADVGQEICGIFPARRRNAKSSAIFL